MISSNKLFDIIIILANIYIGGCTRFFDFQIEVGILNTGNSITSSDTGLSIADLVANLVQV